MPLTDPFDVRTRRWVRPEDLNANSTLFGGTLLRWIDEEATIAAIVHAGDPHVVTKFLSDIDFVSSARQGDVVQLGLRLNAVGRSSISFACEVRNEVTGELILTIERIVFVTVGTDGRPRPHGIPALPAQAPVAATRA